MKIKPTIVVIPILLLFNIACSVGDRSIELTDTGEDNNISCPINIDKHDYDVDGSKRMDITDMSDYSDAGTYTGSDVVIGCDVSIYCQSNRLSGVEEVSVGGEHTCSLQYGGKVKCWGKNVDGQLGDGSNKNKNSPVDVVGLSSGVVAVSAGNSHTCALLENGGVKCWGKNMSAQVGNGTYEDKNTPVDITGLSSGVNSISAGNLYTCVLLDKGKAECWRNWGAEISIDIEIDAVSAISVGGFHSCVILNNGGARCWGSNNYGQLGYGSGIYESYTPVDVEGLDKGVKEISAGYYHTCALLDKGEIKCWGLNNYGQLGNELDTKSFNPIDVEGLTAGVIEISAGGEGLYSHTCALLNTGGVKCWGSNYYGQLGNDINGISTLPVYVVCQ